MEEDLAIGLFNQAVHLCSGAVIARCRGGICLGLDGAVVSGQVANATVLGVERVPKKRDGHGVLRE